MKKIKINEKMKIKKGSEAKISTSTLTRGVTPADMSMRDAVDIRFAFRGVKRTKWKKVIKMNEIK